MGGVEVQIKNVTGGLVPVILGTILLIVVGCGGSADAPADSSSTGSQMPSDFETAAEAIRAEDLEEDIRQISADETEGRSPASEGDSMARAYMAQQLAAAGFSPGAEGGVWEQPFEMVGVSAAAPEVWSFDTGEQSVDLKWWDEYVATSGVQESSASISDAELVFVGYGIQAPEYEWDDYKGLDVSGKVLVMLNNDPDWDPDLFAGERRLYYGRWTYKYEKAAEMGAVAAIIIHTTPSAGYPYQVVQGGWTGEQFELPAEGEARIQIVGWAAEDAARTLLAAAGHDLDSLVESARSADFQPVPLGIETSIDLDVTVRGVETANVLGLLEGSDPELKDEVVIYSAHHDHLGIGEPNEAGDSIYNGARDNASGVAQVLAIARAFGSLSEPPRRSILVALVGAEEQGLLGSRYYARHPTFAPGRMAANINFDSGNIWGRTADIVFVGYGKSSLDGVIETYAGQQERHVQGDQFPDRGFFYRSDQFNFAKIGVPAMYIDGGTEIRGQEAGWGPEQMEAWEAVHYHQPSDELTEDWVFDGMIEDAQVGFRCGVHVAQSDEMPVWNAGDEFEAARLEALAEVAGH